MKSFILTLCTIAVALTASAKPSISTIDLWPSGAPHTSSDPADTARIEIYLPDATKATGRAVVICPGGGYAMLAIGHEGRDWASFFNDMGIAAIVLKYRLPHGNKAIPLEDAEQAIRIVKANARTWHINPNDIGIMGSSAGGHLAATLSTKGNKDVRPAFQILFYPVITMISGYTHQGSHDNLIGADASKNEERKWSADQNVTRETPRAWIALSDDDRIVMPANGVNYYIELYRHDVPASLHVYPSGNHGWGRRVDFRYHNLMELELSAWLQSF